MLAHPAKAGDASRFAGVFFLLSRLFFGGVKKGSEVSVKLQYIVLTLLLPTIYCFGTLVVNSEYGWRAMFGLPLWINLAWCAWRIGKPQGMSFQSWIDRTVGTVLRETSRSQRIARDQGLNKVGSLWCPAVSGRI